MPSPWPGPLEGDSNDPRLYQEQSLANPRLSKARYLVARSPIYDHADHINAPSQRKAENNGPRHGNVEAAQSFTSVKRRRTATGVVLVYWPPPESRPTTEPHAESRLQLRVDAHPQYLSMTPATSSTWPGVSETMFVCPQARSFPYGEKTVSVSPVRHSKSTRISWSCSNKTAFNITLSRKSNSPSPGLYFAG